MNSTRMLAVNTLANYLKSLFLILASLLSFRWVITGLGIEEYGIYILITGVVSSFLLINATLSVSVQRFLSYEYGAKHSVQVREVVAVSHALHAIVAGAVTLGALLLQGPLFAILNLPPGRLEAAVFLYQTVIVSFACSLLQSPAMAFMAAREEFISLAVVEVVEGGMRLLLAVLIPWLPGDRLITFGAWMMVIPILKYIALQALCARAKDFTLRMKLRSAYVKKLVSFSGWYLFGAVANLSRSQILAVLVNNAFGAVTSASFGLANQVFNQVSWFSSIVNRTFQPRITMLHAARDPDGQFSLISTATRASLILFTLFALPAAVWMPELLKAWLRTVPPGADHMCIGFIAIALINVFAEPLMTAIAASGRVAAYQIWIGSILLSGVPISFLMFRSGFSAVSGVQVMLLLTVTGQVVRVWYAERDGLVKAEMWARQVLWPSARFLVCAAGVAWTARHFSGTHGWTIFLLALTATWAATLLCAWRLLLRPEERGQLRGALRTAQQRFPLGLP